MKKTNPFYKINLIMTAITILFFMTANPAEASTIGQAIKISACNASRVVVQGKNQDGNTTVYTLNINNPTCSFNNIPGGWKGTLSVTAYYNVSVEYPYYNGQAVSVSLPGTTQNNDFSVTVPAPTARQWMVWRAQTWVNDHVPYNQGKNRDGYHQDCSGYVSFVWLIKKPGTSPSGLNDYSHNIPFDSLQAGDALNNSSAHSILFVKWVNQNKGTFVAQEEGNPNTGTRQITLTLNKSTGVISQNSYYSYPGSYKAIRLNGL